MKRRDSLKAAEKVRIDQHSLTEIQIIYEILIDTITQLTYPYVPLFIIDKVSALEIRVKKMPALHNFTTHKQNNYPHSIEANYLI